MKPDFKVFAVLLLAVFSYTLSAQQATIVLNYMKVTQGMEGQYLESEQAWKKIHEKRIEAGIMTGWQLWQKVYAADNDPYQYITIDWYKDLAHSLAGDPEGFWEDKITPLFTDEEAAKYWDMTMKSRSIANKEVMHRTLVATSDEPSRYIQVNRMKVKLGDEGAYLEAEETYAKPLQEAKIKAGQMTHWGVWQAWPYEEGQIRFSTVDGYKSAEQMTGDGEDLLAKVFPGLTWPEWAEKVGASRKQATIEIWELVDFAFPEE